MILQNAQWVITIELLNALQALDFHLPLQPGPGVKAARDTLRKVVPELVADRLMTQDLEAVRELLLSGELRKAVEAKIGKLN
jgi:histidine ammonia-lyase